MLRLALVLAFVAFAPPQAMAQNRLARSADIDAYLSRAIETTKIPAVYDATAIETLQGFEQRAYASLAK